MYSKPCYGDRIIEFLQNFVKGQFLGKRQNVRPKKRQKGNNEAGLYRCEANGIA